MTCGACHHVRQGKAGLKKSVPKKRVFYQQQQQLLQQKTAKTKLFQAATLFFFSLLQPTVIDAKIKIAENFSHFSERTESILL